MSGFKSVFLIFIGFTANIPNVFAGARDGLDLSIQRHINSTSSYHVTAQCNHTLMGEGQCSLGPGGVATINVKHVNRLLVDGTREDVTRYYSITANNDNDGEICRNSGPSNNIEKGYTATFTDSLHGKTLYEEKVCTTISGESGLLNNRNTLGLVTVTEEAGELYIVFEDAGNGGWNPVGDHPRTTKKVHVNFDEAVIPEDFYQMNRVITEDKPGEYEYATVRLSKDLFESKHRIMFGNDSSMNRYMGEIYDGVAYSLDVKIDQLPNGDVDVIFDFMPSTVIWGAITHGKPMSPTFPPVPGSDGMGESGAEAGYGTPRTPIVIFDNYKLPTINEGM